MSRLARWIATIADTALDRLAPMHVHARSYLAMSDLDRRHSDADRLADAEAAIDSWDPPTGDYDWRELNDLFTLAPDQTIDDFVNLNRDLFAPDLPVGAVATPPASATGADGPTPGEADPVATIVAVVLRGQGINSAAIYADLVARELRHHFDFQQK